MRCQVPRAALAVYWPLHLTKPCSDLEVAADLPERVYLEKSFVSSGWDDIFGVELGWIRFH